jgi:hypothetical protein
MTTPGSYELTVTAGAAKSVAGVEVSSGSVLRLMRPN